jgi:hypothetical protein
MTMPKNARGEPGRESHRPAPQEPRHEPRLRPSEERLLGAVRTTRRIAAVALILAVAAVGLVAWRLLLAPGDAACQTTAWDVAPAAENLPAGWTISATQYDVNRKQMTLLGPAPQDQSTTQAVVYATITCYPQGADQSVTRSAGAATSAGQTVTQRADLGQQGFSAVDTSGATFVQFRYGSVVVYLAASGDATSDEVEGVASAFDLSMGGDGAQAPIGTPDAGSASPSQDLSSPGASDSPLPSESAAAAPELESLLPTKVGDTTLTIESALGTTILGSDQGSRAITAALRTAGKQPDDLRVAQAYDATGTADLSILAVRVVGMDQAALKSLVMESWLAASGAGVKEDTVTLAGKTFTRIDYGDEGSKNYLLGEGDRILIIETADADVAAQAAAALP